jgi:GT2 family glycosyltransferase
MLVYNANLYTYHTLKTLKKTKGIDYEVIVLDNNSKQSTYRMLGKLKKLGYIDKIISLNENSFFVRGNNIASKLCSPESDYILLLNSDVEIRNELWLKKMVEQLKKTKGAIATQICCREDNRPDGWCYLINKDIYLNKLLDEKNFKHTYALAKFNAQLLEEGYQVITIEEFENFIFHFGGKSGKVTKLKGMDTTNEQIKKWFKGNKCKVIKRLNFEEGKTYSYKFSLVWIRHNIYNILHYIGKKIINK